MTAISEMGIFDDTQPITKSKLYSKEAAKITPEEITAFMKRMAMNGHGHSALKNVEALLSEIRSLIASGQIESAKLERFSLPVRKYTVLDLYSEFADFTLARQDALVVSILSGLTLSEVVTLKRKDVAKLSIDSESMRIINEFPAHISSELVFWEYKGKRLSDLYDLPQQFRLISQVDIQHYRDNLNLHGSIMSNEDYWLFRRAFWKNFLQTF